MAGDNSRNEDEADESRAKPAVEPSAAKSGPSTTSVFRNRNFMRLWMAQVVASLGDWIGLAAIVALATRLGQANAALATALVMFARIVPGFLLAPVAGVLVDRWDRRHAMIICDISRGAIMLVLPFVTAIWQLLVISFLLELFSIVWMPAKEALVPNMVGPRQLANANSLGMVAAYGTFPIGAALFSTLAAVATWFGALNVPLAGAFSQETLAIWFDALTFFATGLLVYSLRLPEGTTRPRRSRELHGIDMGQTFRELKDGLSYIRSSQVVRVVIIGMGVALIGAGSVIPLGATFATRDLNGGPAAYGLILTALGLGAALGIVGVIIINRSKPGWSLLYLFSLGMVACGVFLFLIASLSRLSIALVATGLFGVASGTTYICGFTSMQKSVTDELRGRVFAALLTIMRFCILLAMTIAPLLAGIFSKFIRQSVADGGIDFWAFRLQLSGTRMVFWLGAILVFATGLWALRQVKGIESFAQSHPNSKTDLS